MRLRRSRMTVAGRLARQQGRPDCHFGKKATEGREVGGQRGIRTLDGVLSPYTLSKRAPSATRPSVLN